MHLMPTDSDNKG